MERQLWRKNLVQQVMSPFPLTVPPTAEEEQHYIESTQERARVSLDMGTPAAIEDMFQDAVRDLASQLVTGLLNSLDRLGEPGEFRPEAGGRLILNPGDFAELRKRTPADFEPCFRSIGAWGLAYKKALVITTSQTPTGRAYVLPPKYGHYQDRLQLGFDSKAWTEEQVFRLHVLLRTWVRNDGSPTPIIAQI